jgi:hypothetical protein
LEALEERLAPANAPFFSMPTDLAGNQGTVVTVPVTLSHITDGSNTGLAAMDLSLAFDPTVFTVADADISPGALLTNPPPAGTWTFTHSVEASNGEIDVSASSSGPMADITDTTGGVLVNINFHIKGNAHTGNSTIQVNLPSSPGPDGGISDAFAHAPAFAEYTLDPADQVNGVVNVQNFAPVTTLSIPTGIGGTAGQSVTVPINISNPDPVGSAGMVAADMAILYDPNFFTVAATGAVAAGSVLPSSGWTITYGVDTSGNNTVDATKAALGLHLANSDGTALTSTTAGSLWLVTFQINSGATGSSVLNMVPTARIGASFTPTNATGLNRVYQLNPAPTNSPNDPVDGSITVTHLAFLNRPRNTQAGAPIYPAVRVAVEDAFGNVVTTDNSNVTVALGNNPSGGTLSGTLTVTAVNGIAAFGDLSIDQEGFGYTLAAIDGNLAGATSRAFNIRSQPVVRDGGFEQPQVGAGSYASDPTGSAWTWSGSAGVSGNGSLFTSGNPDAPQGQQVGFLQGQGSVSQPLSMAAGNYSLALLAAQSASNLTYQTVQVYIDGNLVDTFTPDGTNYQAFNSVSFTVGTGPHTLTLVGLDPDGLGNTFLLDQVALHRQN